jgi:hypothetical protein
MRDINRQVDRIGFEEIFRDPEGCSQLILQAAGVVAEDDSFDETSGFEPVNLEIYREVCSEDIYPRTLTTRTWHLLMSYSLRGQSQLRRGVITQEEHDELYGPAKFLPDPTRTTEAVPYKIDDFVIDSTNFLDHIDWVDTVRQKHLNMGSVPTAYLGEGGIGQMRYFRLEYLLPRLMDPTASQEIPATVQV